MATITQTIYEPLRTRQAPTFIKAKTSSGNMDTANVQLGVWAVAWHERMCDITALGGNSSAVPDHLSFHRYASTMDATPPPRLCRAYILDQAGNPWAIKEVPPELPKDGEISVRVLCCGICHTDLDIADGRLGSMVQWPATPGHEFIGDVVEVGKGVTKWKVGDRVGGSWHGGHDQECRPCLLGVFQGCVNQIINGVSKPGGFADICLLRSEAAVRIPRDLDPMETAPLLCAGVTVFNSMRQQHIKPGEAVAIQGLGGLGHLGVQYANKMGFRVVALSTNSEKKTLAMEMGAHHFIDTSTQNASTELLKLGGAKMIVITAPNPDVIGELADGLSWQGKLLVLNPLGNITVDSSVLVHKSCSVQGWHAGHARDCEEAIEFARLHGIKCWIEEFQFGQLAEAAERVKSGQIRFRAVIKM